MVGVRFGFTLAKAMTSSGVSTEKLSPFKLKIPAKAFRPKLKNDCSIRFLAPKKAAPGLALPWPPESSKNIPVNCSIGRNKIMAQPSPSFYQRQHEFQTS